MRIVTVGTEKNLNQLLDKYYSGLEPAGLKDLREATLQANPHVRAAGTFKPGAVLVLPDVNAGDVKHPATNDAAGADSAGAILGALQAYVPVLQKHLDAQRELLSQATRLAKSAAFRKALDGAPNSDATDMAKSLAASLKEEDDSLKESLAALPKAAAALKDDLSSLQKKLSGTGR